MKLNFKTRIFFDLMDFNGKSIENPLKIKSCLIRLLAESLILFRFLDALTALKNSYSLDLFVAFCIKTKSKAPTKERTFTVFSYFIKGICSISQSNSIKGIILLITLLFTINTNAQIKITKHNDHYFIPLHQHLKEPSFQDSVTTKMYLLQNDSSAYFIHSYNTMDTLFLTAMKGNFIVEVYGKEDQCFSYNLEVTGQSWYINGSYGLQCRTNRKIKFIEGILTDRLKIPLTNIKQL